MLILPAILGAQTPNEASPPASRWTQERGYINGSGFIEFTFNPRATEWPIESQEDEFFEATSAKFNFTRVGISGGLLPIRGFGAGGSLMAGSGTYDLIIDGQSVTEAFGLEKATGSGFDFDAHVYGAVPFSPAQHAAGGPGLGLDAGAGFRQAFWTFTGFNDSESLFVEAVFYPFVNLHLLYATESIFFRPYAGIILDVVITREFAAADASDESVSTLDSAASAGLRLGAHLLFQRLSIGFDLRIYDNETNASAGIGINF